MNAYKFPSSIRQESFQLNDFLGVDFTTHESEVASRRSPDAVNMLSGKTGSMDKRTGLKLEKKHTGLIGAMTPVSYIYSQYSGGSGWETYNVRNDGVLYTSGNEVRLNIISTEYQYYGFNNSVVLKEFNSSTGLMTTFTKPEGKTRIVKLSQYLYLLITDDVLPDKPVSGDSETNKTFFIKLVEISGNDYYSYPTHDLGFELENETLAYIVHPSDVGFQDAIGIKVPTTSIARSFDGLTSTSFEGANLLIPKRKNTFLANGTATTYKVDATITSLLLVEKLNADRTWSSVSGCTYSGNVVTFPTAPAITPITGEDNIRITFRVLQNQEFNLFKNFGYFGFNGSSDYIFMISRTKTKFNRDWRIELSTLYMDENAFTDFGTNETTIIGYGIYGSQQIILAKNNGDSSAIFIRSASLDANGELTFPVVVGVSGVGAINGDTFASLRGYNMWQTEYGVSSLVTNDITNIQSVQDRGFYINQQAKNNSVEYAFAIVFDNKYFLFDGLRCFVADSRYKSNERLASMESYQYEWFYLQFPKFITSACILLDSLYLGSSDGNVFKLKIDTEENAFFDEVSDTTYLIGETGEPYRWVDYNASQPQLTEYHVGDIVVDGFGVNTKYYICIKAHNATETGIIITNEFYWLDILRSLARESFLIPIMCYWTTPIMNMGNITVKKTLKNLWVRLPKYKDTGVRIYYSTQGLIKERYDGIFDFNDIDFSRFTFSTDTDPMVVVTNRQERKFMSIQFKIESRDGTPMSLLEIVGKYTINNTYKG